MYEICVTNFICVGVPYPSQLITNSFILLLEDYSVSIGSIFLFLVKCKTFPVNILERKIKSVTFTLNLLP